MRKRKERAHRDAGQEHGGGLRLVLDPQLVRFRAAVHAGQGTEDGVDDEVRTANRQEDECRRGDAERDPDGSKVIAACWGNGIKGADVRHD
ncbi:hypothetical protein [Arthrobacter sp. NA-172]|uniref:hypothetical protein n=1 Tax=Arthrobacter sp. NA-172 TaxID=3367524 RepID=UPI00375500F7